MVRGLIPSWTAASLLEAPITSCPNTSPSRLVNDLRPASAGIPSNALPFARRLRAPIAACTHAETVLPRNGLFDEIEGAMLDGFDRHGDVALARDHEDGR